MDDPANVEKQGDPQDFTEIERKAIERALRSHSLEEVKTAVQIIAAVADKRRDLYSLEQDCDERKKRQQSGLRRWLRSFADFLSPNVAAFAALATAIALISQVIIAGTTAKSQKQAQEDSQWRDAMKSVKLSAPDDALMGAFEMQSFFDSKQYGRHARSIVTTLLPEVEAPTGFDVVFFNLAHRVCNNTSQECAPDPALNAEIQQDLLGIGRMVAVHDRDLFESVVPEGCMGANCKAEKFRQFVKDPETFFPEKNPDKYQLGLAWSYSWELDSVSNAMIRLWSGPHRALQPQGTNLAGIVISGGDLSATNFSGANLAGAHIWGAIVTDADFTGVPTPDDSDWQDTNWWRAKVMSCALANYLKAKFPPDSSHLEGTIRAEKLVQNCQPVEEH